LRETRHGETSFSQRRKGAEFAKVHPLPWKIIP
jgi:hypothetical protein